jgi:hypothetical protein
MGKLKIKVELNKGGVGISLAKLASISTEMERFLELFSTDVGIEKPEWTAKDFENNSVDFVSECIIEDSRIQEFGYKALRAVFSNQPRDDYGRALRPATWRQFAAIANPIDADEIISLGVFNGSAVPEMFSLSKERVAEESLRSPKFAQYYGQVQGIIHAFYKESEKPKIVIRDISSGDLVDCYFKRDDIAMYHSAVNLLTDPNAVVFVEGDVSEDLDSGAIAAVTVRDFHEAPAFDVVKFNQGIGAFPDATGDLSTEEFVEKIRGNGE